MRNIDSALGTSGLGAGQQETDDKGRLQLRLFAAVKLFAATGEAVYRDYVDAHYTEEPMMASWYISAFNAGSARTLLYYASLPGATSGVASTSRTRSLHTWGRSDYGGWGAVDAQKDPYRAYIDS